MIKAYQDLAQKYPEPGEDAPEVVSDSGEDGVCGIAGTALEVAAAEVALCLHVADQGSIGGSASQLSFDGAEDAALLARDEDAARIRASWPRYPLST